MDKAKKNQTKKILTWGLLAALVVILTAMPLLAKREAETDGPVATVHCGTVETGTIRTALHGGGILSTKDVETITLPSGVKITEFLVKNGDLVTAGTPLAAVDKVSVMTAITQVTDTMEYLQEEMISAKDEKLSTTVAATAGGRIKKVYAKTGDSVQEVMLRDGALALLSLDGLMAVEIEKKLDILPGDTVTVTFPQGTEVTGRIASNLDGVITITLEDEGYEIGETVTVATKDGVQVGTGALYVHNAWSASAFSGIIKTVSAKEETKVSAGSTLFTLTNTDFRGRLEYLSSLHREYEELLQELFTMYNSGTIDAPCAGTIAGVDKDSPYLLAAQSDAPAQANLLNVTEEPGWTLMLLSNMVYDVGEIPCDPNAEDCQASVHTKCIKACTHANSETGCSAERHYPDCICACRSASSLDVCTATKHKLSCIEACDPTNSGLNCEATGAHKNACIKSCKHANTPAGCKDAKYPHYPDCIQACIQSDGTRDCPATKHHAGCIEACTHADSREQCPGTLYHYADCIKCCITSDSGQTFCPATKHNDRCFFAAMTYKAKVAIVTAVGRELVVRWDASGQEYDVEKTGTGWKFAANPDFNVDLLVAAGPTVTVSNPKAYKPGDVIFVITGYKGKNPEWTGVSVFMRASEDVIGNVDVDLDQIKDALTGMLMPQIPDLSALLNGFGNFRFYVPSPVEEEKLFDLEGSTLMTVSPQETVRLTISLDEQDIAKVQVGQKATVKVEALSGESFEAQVTEVATRGTNSGGSSKFAVKLELSKTKDMLDGMSATASLPLQETEPVPTIPVIALTEQGNQTMVYTALDKDGKPSAPVPVTIGLSDGITAQILSGLEVGDTYYYSYYDVLELDTGVGERFTLN